MFDNPISKKFKEKVDALFAKYKKPDPIAVNPRLNEKLLDAGHSQRRIDESFGVGTGKVPLEPIGPGVKVGELPPQPDVAVGKLPPQPDVVVQNQPAPKAEVAPPVQKEPEVRAAAMEKTPMPTFDSEETNQKIEDYAKKIKVKIDAKNQIKDWNKGKPSLAAQNNNPGNLKFAGQPNAIKGKAGFAKFPTPEIGFRAAVKQMQADQKAGRTLRQLITKYAPPHENDTELYISDVAEKLGVADSILASELDPIMIAKEIVRFESQTAIEEL